MCILILLKFFVVYGIRQTGALPTTTPLANFPSTLKKENLYLRYQFPMLCHVHVTHFHMCLYLYLGFLFYAIHHQYLYSF